VPELTEYATAGPFTDLGGVDPLLLARATADPIEICRPVTGLVIQPGDAAALGVPSARLDERNVRPARQLVDTLLAHDRSPLDVPRPPESRVVGTCRHFAVLSCALLRHRGIPARARCGFATYFQPGQGVDHWITEYWHDGDGRWARVDSEILSLQLLAHPDDLRPGEFLTGGEAWAAFRAGEIDASRFGVYGTSNWGPAEIRGNAVRDLAALNKAEMLPWDEWGRMTASYHGETGADYDELMDAIAAVCARDDPAEVAQLYAVEELRVPAELIC
jgi:hypothetical protein